MIVTSEAGLRKYLEAGISEDCHLSPIESHLTQPGVPDYAYTVSGVAGWLELKAGSVNHVPKLRLAQKLWLADDVAHGGNPLILCCSSSVRDGRNLFGIIHGSKAGLVYGATSIRTWESAFSTSWQDSIPWFEFLSILHNPETQK